MVFCILLQHAALPYIKGQVGCTSNCTVPQCVHICCCISKGKIRSKRGQYIPSEEKLFPLNTNFNICMLWWLWGAVAKVMVKVVVNTATPPGHRTRKTSDLKI